MSKHKALAYLLHATDRASQLKLDDKLPSK